MKRDRDSSGKHASVDFGAYLRSCREAAGFRSQRAAIGALEPRRERLSQGLLAHYETGRVRNPDPRILARLAALYGVDFLEMILRLARARWASAQVGEESNGTTRWRLVESATTPLSAIGTAAGLEGDQFRARADLLREVQILDVEGIANWQRSVEGLESFWVIAPYFLDDEDDRLLGAVVENLKRGVRYTYFIYRDAETRFRALQDKLHALVGKGGRLREPVTAVWLPPGALTWLHADYVVANPTQRARAVGFQNLRHYGKTRFAFRLPDPDLLELVDKVNTWMASVDRKG
ncbi:MAG TPA: helix-turn-helix domain-containing protein [Planctomycetota bacterium]|jgi:transcriptional regulator with XRE-family HTH domain|nr:helix-turn-helix domain-containing protein [Planctomycetota bacterium]